MNNFVGAMVALFLSATSAFQPVATTLPELAEEPPSPEEVALNDFLVSKGSPMPADVLIQYPNWEIMLAIATAESSLCKRPAGAYNCYGIKDFRKGSHNFGGYRNFESWDESIGYMSELLFKYDGEDGSPTPHAMVIRWTGYNPPSQGWINNVSGSLRDIERNITAKAVAIAT